MSDSSDLVTVAVPVYNGEDMVSEALESVLQQTHQNFEVLISVDLSTDRTSEVCRGFLADPRFRMAVQDRHLGWVDNFNWLRERVETPFFVLLPHDDLVEEGYLARLLEVARANPAAAVVYSDIQTFGRPEDCRIAQQSIRGARFTRLLTYLVEHYSGVAWRGLIRRHALTGAGPAARNAHGDFAAETVWLFQLLMHGEFVRVAEPLYNKRYWQGSVHDRWLNRDPSERVLTWREHCLALAEKTLELELSPGEQAMMIQALVYRLFRSNPNLGPFVEVNALSEEEREEMLTEFLSGLEELGSDGPLGLRIPDKAQLRFSR